MSMRPNVTQQHHNGIHTDCDRITCDHWQRQEAIKAVLVMDELVVRVPQSTDWWNDPERVVRCGDCGDYLYRRLPDRPGFFARMREAWRAGGAAVDRAVDEIKARREKGR